MKELKATSECQGGGRHISHGGFDFSATDVGCLKKTHPGDPATTTYPFSARYTYNNNGTVSQAEFYNAGTPATQKRYRYAFPNYDALNRLKSADFSSWSGSAWTSTLAYDLAGINYDVAGNLTALQRYRETATLLDNLSYTYPGSSNSLSSVTDAVGTTTVAWDAEAGSFTYDANGNLVTVRRHIPSPQPRTIIGTFRSRSPVEAPQPATGTTLQGANQQEGRICREPDLPSGRCHHPRCVHDEQLRNGGGVLSVVEESGGGQETGFRKQALLPF
jgi:hypothetical protein